MENNPPNITIPDVIVMINKKIWNYEQRATNDDSVLPVLGALVRVRDDIERLWVS